MHSSLGQLQDQTRRHFLSSSGVGLGAIALSSLNGEMMTLMQMLEEADAEPTTTLATAVATVRASFAGIVAKWTALKASDLARLTARLKAAGVSL